MSLPLYVEPVIGYRSWTVDGQASALRARITRVPWNYESPTEAECVQRNNKFWEGYENSLYKLPLDHEVPDSQCSCGLYAFHSLSDALKDYGKGPTTVMGAGVFWGKIVVHTAGFKAQYGRVVALAEHRSPLKRHATWKQELEKVVARYNVPVVPYDLLREYAETFGKSLSDDYLNQ